LRQVLFKWHRPKKEIQSFYGADKGKPAVDTLQSHWTNERKRYKKKAKQKPLAGAERPASESQELRLLNEERRRAIFETLNRDGRVLVTELARQFDTSQVTIRKDLEILHSHGMLHRTHGGALPAREGVLEDPTLREKEKLHRREKLRIAEAAAHMVKEGQVLILDSGTTTTAIARALRTFHNITIVTNAVNIAAELSGTDVEVILTGGTLRKNSFSLVGPIAEDTLRRLSADILFLGVDGFDVQYGLSTPNLLEAKVNRVMVEIARRTVVVCDASKFGRRSLSLILPPSSVHEVISDHGIPKPDLRTLKKSGIEVTIV
jgi:DeoR family transcriptional regulator, aga operon transcriptional repressor